MALFTALALSMLLNSAPNRPVYRWKNVEIVGGGFVSGLSFHPKERGLIYARTDIGGAYRWDRRSQRWIPLQDWLTQDDWNLYGVESIGLDPSDAKRLYLATGTYTNSWGGNGAILRSTDQGRHFQRTDLPFKLGGNEDGRSIGERLAVDPNFGAKIYLGTRHNGLWVSRDYGATWAQDLTFPIQGRTNGIGIGFLVFDPKSGGQGKPSSTIYAGVCVLGPNLWVSHDAGKSWQAVADQPTGMLPHHGVLAADGSLYLTYGNGPGPNGMSDGAVWRYEPGVGTWKNITPVPPHGPAEHGFGYAGLAVDAKNPLHVLVSTMDRWNPGDDIFSSQDGGTTWRSYKAASVRNSSAAPFLRWNRPEAEFGHWIGDVEMDPFDPNHVLYVTGATIWGTDEAEQALAHWTVRASGLEETAVIDLVSPPEGAPVISGLGDIGGFAHWDLNSSPKSGMLTHPLLGNTDSIDFAELAPLNVVRVGRAGGTEAHGGISSDGGRTWLAFATEPKGSKGSGTVALSADAKTLVWSPVGAAISRSTDGGQTWSECLGVPDNLRIVSDRVNPNRFYGLDPSTGQRYASLDGAKTFLPIGTPIPTDEHAKLRPTPGVEGDLWLTSASGLLHSLDGGISFQRLNGVDAPTAIGFGRPPAVGAYPALFLIGSVRGQRGIYRSYNIREPWVRIDDAEHHFGTVGTIVGDRRIVGRCYIGTNGRGVLYGDPISKQR